MRALRGTILAAALGTMLPMALCASVHADKMEALRGSDPIGVRVVELIDSAVKSEE